MREKVLSDTPSTDRSSARASRFRLMRYFVLTSLVAFAVVGTVLFVLQRGEETFFEQVQQEQAAYFAKAQGELAHEHKEAARSDLLATHEAGHVNLTRVLANVLWSRDIAPLLARAERLPISECQALAEIGTAGTTGSANPRQDCFAALGARIKALPGFAALDAKAYETMKASNVFKIKVFDLRGITVYSSEHSQVGEDKAGNLGWKSAMSGQPASELTHRDRFSTFEGVVENRDLISSYLPVRAPGSDMVVGVFEIYSDVTPLLEQIGRASTRIANMTAAHQSRVEQTAQANVQKVETSSQWFLLIVGSLLMLLYFALLLLVRNGQRLIDRQARAQEQAAQREQSWHREKMATMATMAAAVSHEVGNPLGIITLLAQDIADLQARGEYAGRQPQEILKQAWRIADMTRQMAHFASARSEFEESVDVNQMAKAVCDFLGFDRRFEGTRIEFRPAESLPARVVVPDHLNEILMNVVQTCAETAPRPARVLIETAQQGSDVLIRIGREAASSDARLPLADVSGDARIEAAQQRMQQMNGRLSCSGATVEISLSRGVATATA
jgi:signal transduction histidine kinase